MRICFIADGRSPIALSWIRYFVTRHEVHLISTSACGADAVPGAALHLLSGQPNRVPKRSRAVKLGLDRSAIDGRTIWWIWDNIVVPSKCLVQAVPTRRLVEMIKPDLLHALRIPPEGELAMFSGFHPVLISVWGNDLTLYAAKSLVHRTLTRKLLANVDGLLADCEVDILRARQYGMLPSAVTASIPGAGGPPARVLNACPRCPETVS
jgi:hypothetical protein